MPQIEATFVVEPYDITIQSPTSNIQVQPTVVDLNIFSAGYSNPAGNTGELQYNNGGVLGGVPIAVYTGGNLVFGNVTNVKLPGGSNAYFLQTDGTGNITWAPGTVNANTGNGIAVGANTQIQITDGTGNFVSAPGFTFNYVSNTLTVPGNAIFAGNIQSGNANLGNAAVANYFIGNGAFLTGVGGSEISNGSSNVKVLANSDILFAVGGVPNVTIVTGTGINVAGYVDSNSVVTNDIILDNDNIHLGSNAGIGVQSANAIAIGHDAGKTNQGANSIAIGPSSGITQAFQSIAIGTQAGQTQGNESIAIGFLAAQNNQANYSIAIGLQAGRNNQSATAIAIGKEAAQNNQSLSAIAIGENSGTNAQGNLAIAIGYQAGRETQGSNSIAIGAVTGNYLNAISANNSILLNATGGPVSANTANAFFVKPIRNATQANLLYYNQSTGEITHSNTIPTLATISNGTSNVNIPSANGNITFTVNNNSNLLVISTIGINVTGNVSAANFIGNISASNIVGTVANANYATNAGSATNAGTVTTAAQPNITSLGNLTSLRINSSNIHLGSSAGLSNQSGNAIAIGLSAGTTNQRDAALAIGLSAGTTDQGTAAIAIGASAGTSNQAGGTLAVGWFAGSSNQGLNSVSVGRSAGQNSQGREAIAIGYNAALSTQSVSSIAIGFNAGRTNQGANSIAIGANAGYANAPANSIILNATGANLIPLGSDALYIKPVRTGSALATNNILMYDTTYGEISYNTLQYYTGYIKTISTTVGALTAAATIGAGGRAFVTDANTTTFNAVVGGGGANSVPVFSDGTNWRVG